MADVLPFVPLAPAVYQKAAEDIKAIAHFVRSELGPVEIDLLSYNPLGESKYERLDQTTAHKEIQSEEYVDALRSIVSLDSSESEIGSASVPETE